MTARRLISLAEKRLARDKLPTHQMQGFSGGGEWMMQLMRVTPYKKMSFYAFGVVKYTLSLLPFIVLLMVGVLPLSVSILAGGLLFYVIEIHFLFLFPIIIDGKSPVLKKCIQSTYLVGFGTAYGITVSLAIHMIAGLLNPRNPLYNWYTGCAAIVVWYEQEVRDRL